MKLLHPENVRVLVLRQPGANSRPSLRDQMQCAPENGNDLYNAVPYAKVSNNLAAVDPCEVKRLLALDIEELMRHTFRVQRQRHTGPHVSLRRRTFYLGSTTSHSTSAKEILAFHVKAKDGPR